MEVPTFTGGPSGNPVRSMSPDSPWTMRSYPGRPASGPDSPKPEIAPYTSRRLIRDSARYPRPRRSIVPGRKFSRRTSLRVTSRFRIFRPSRAFRLRVRLCLFRLTDMKYVASPPANGGQWRVSSPRPGSSILITSAPMSPSSIEQNGRARMRVRSTTRSPDNGTPGLLPSAKPDLMISGLDERTRA